MAEAKGKKSMIIYHEWLETFEDLSDEEFGKLLRAALKLDATGEATQFTDRALNMALKQIIAVAKENHRAYEEKCEKNRERAIKRWNANAYGRIPKMPTHTNDADTDTDTDTDTESDIYIKPKIDDIRLFFKKNNYHSNPDKFEAYYAARGWKDKNGTPIVQWDKAAKSWELGEQMRQQKPKNRFNDFQQRDYDWADLEKRLVNQGMNG